MMLLDGMTLALVTAAKATCAQLMTRACLTRQAVELMHGCVNGARVTGRHSSNHA